SQFLGGSIDEVALYNVALSPAQAGTHYALRTAAASSPVSLALTASDPDGDVLTYSATGLPPGMTINSKTGVIAGAPLASGLYSVTAAVSDGLVKTTQSFV